LLLPGLLAALPLAAVRALAFVDLFDIVLGELPGHGASGQVEHVSLTAFAAEYAALLDTALPRAKSVTVIGESLGGLIALALARQRPDRIRHVVLVDTPFHLTRPDLAAWIGETWRGGGSRPYVRRICREILGFDPTDPSQHAALSRHDMVRGLACDIVHIIGGAQAPAGPGSAVTDADLARLGAENPMILTTLRIPGTGHAVLLDNPSGARAALQAFIVPTPNAPAVS
jgi:pimeloyl-ACP methyl ester carboxylesterase